MRFKNSVARPIETGVTIDPLRARCLDDGISVICTPNGWKLSISIPDVPAYIQPGHPVFEQAKRIAFSRYVGGTLVEPMLPKRFSEELLSLRHGKLTPAVTFRFEIGRDGVVLASEVERTLFRSIEEFTYSQVDAQLSDEHQSHFWVPYAQLALFLAERQRGAEMGIPLMRPLESIAHLVIHSCMTFLNGEVAKFFLARKVVGLFRNHSMLGRFATYADENKGHEALRREVYCHVSAPLRRFASLVNLTILMDILEGREPSFRPAQVQIWGEHINRMLSDVEEERVRPRERESRLPAHLFTKIRPSREESQQPTPHVTKKPSKLERLERSFRKILPNPIDRLCFVARVLDHRLQLFPKRRIDGGEVCFEITLRLVPRRPNGSVATAVSYHGYSLYEARNGAAEKILAIFSGSQSIQ